MTLAIAIVAFIVGVDGRGSLSEHADIKLLLILHSVLDVLNCPPSNLSFILTVQF